MFDFLRSSRAARLVPMLTGLVLSGQAGAAFEREVDFIVYLERNSEIDDRNFYGLSLDLNDEFGTPEYSMRYDLNSRFFEDYDTSESNEQHSGELVGQYYFSVPTLRWNLNASVDILPTNTGIEIDEFESQSLSSVATGPVLSFSQGIRGSVDLGLEAIAFNYSDADLDSKTNGARLIYQYPISQLMLTGVDLTYLESRYDDDINSPNDYDLESIGLFFTSQTANVTYRLEAASNTIDAADGPIDETSYEILVDYTINSFSSLSLRLLDTLQTAEILNLLPGNLEQSRFIAGIFRNERTQLSYIYAKRDLLAGIRIYSNRLEDVVSSIEQDDDFEGWGVSVENRISENLRLKARFDRTTSKLDEFDEDDLEVIFSYSLRHTSKFSSSISLLIEAEKVDDRDFDNVGLLYQLDVHLIQ